MVCSWSFVGNHNHECSLWYGDCVGMYGVTAVFDVDIRGCDESLLVQWLAARGQFTGDNEVDWPSLLHEVFSYEGASADAVTVKACARGWVVDVSGDMCMDGCVDAELVKWCDEVSESGVVVDYSVVMESWDWVVGRHECGVHVDVSGGVEDTRDPHSILDSAFTIVREAVSTHDVKVIGQCARSNASFVRASAAKNPALPENLAWRLAEDRAGEVRTAVCGNRAVKKEIRAFAALVG